jgi:prevent-host-death family protein
MEKAVKGKSRFLVSRRGKPTVVILGIRDYMEHFIKKPTFLVDIQEQAVHTGLDAMTDQEVNDEIKAARRARRT